MFPLIADPGNYRAQTIDMVADARARDYWIQVFDDHTNGLADVITEAYGNTPEVRRRADDCADAFWKVIAEVREDHAAHGPLSIHQLCDLRQQQLKAHGFPDPYKPVKTQENETAWGHLVVLLDELDAMELEDRVEALVRGVFAGNIFDLGCVATTELYQKGEIDFRRTRNGLPKRPWLVDDFDALHASLTGPPHFKAVVFVDNAGADVVLGMAPLVRYLLRRGTRVVLTANTEPALNDVTHDEMVTLVNDLASIDPAFRQGLDAGHLVLVPSGNGLPVIDLSRVSEELAREAHDADLLVLEGMGRALESNFSTRFTCDTLKIAMVKEEDIARRLGGKVYDVVCRFESAKDGAGATPSTPVMKEYEIESGSGTCGSCGAPSDAGDRFCSQCGARLGAG
jgi:type II pantothenate kinase